MKFKAAIFDLDGTLLDSMSIWSNLCREFLLRHHIDEEIDLDGKLGVISMRNALEYVIKEFSLEVSIDEACAETWQIVEEFYRSKAKIKPGIEATVPTDEPAEEREVGYQIGNLCPSDELKVITSDAVTEETIDPTKTGKVTIINFWGTWCSACVAELPYFDQIATEFEGQVEVFAVHTSSVLVTAPNYIANNYPNSNITFLADYGDGGSLDAFYTALGGADSGGAYPYTVVLDENGVILFKTFASMHYETLLEQVQSALNG